MCFLLRLSEITIAASIFQRFYLKLVETLPMDDAFFTSHLFTYGLLPGNLKGKLAASSDSPAEKAITFLDHVIKPSVTTPHAKEFSDLLKVMEDSDYSALTDLAETIGRELNQISKDKTGV